MHQKLVSRWELESAWCRWKAMAVKSCINLWSSKQDLAELFKQYYLLFLQMLAGLLHQYYFKQFLSCSSHLLLSSLCVYLPSECGTQMIWCDQRVKKPKGQWLAGGGGEEDLLSAEKELSLMTSPFGGSWPCTHVGSAICVLAPWRWVEMSGGKEKRKW